jgi:hypothetical protein
MSLAEIKDAVAGLSQEQLAELTAFILEQDSGDAWDAAAGKLDFLTQEADQARRERTLRDWPPVS